MGHKTQKEEVIIDVESVNLKGEESSRCITNGEVNTFEGLNTNWSGYASTDGSSKEEEAISSSRDSPNSIIVRVSDADSQEDEKLEDMKSVSMLEKKTRFEKPKKKKSKKPPKPPRPPKAPSLDAAEAKLVRELSELATLKRERVDRMKALKKMKNAKSMSSTSNMWALIITVLFCFIIFWQGLCSKSSSNLSFEGSPVSPVGSRGGLISVQFYKKTSESNFNDSTSAFPDVVEKVSGSDNQR